MFAEQTETETIQLRFYCNICPFFFHAREREVTRRTKKNTARHTKYKLVQLIISFGFTIVPSIPIQNIFQRWFVDYSSSFFVIVAFSTPPPNLSHLFSFFFPSIVYGRNSCARVTQLLDRQLFNEFDVRRTQ